MSRTTDVTGRACSTDEDCLGWRCVSVGETRERVCSGPCSASDDCLPGWTCEGTSGFCACSAAPESCNLEDDDCDGDIDEGDVCGFASCSDDVATVVLEGDDCRSVRVAGGAPTTCEVLARSITGPTFMVLAPVGSSVWVRLDTTGCIAEIQPGSSESRPPCQICEAAQCGGTDYVLNTNAARVLVSGASEVLVCAEPL